MTWRCKCKISPFCVFHYRAEINIRAPSLADTFLTPHKRSTLHYAELMTAMTKLDENLLLECVPGVSLYSKWLSFTAKCSLSQWGLVKERDEAIFLHHLVMITRRTCRRGGHELHACYNCLLHGCTASIMSMPKNLPGVSAMLWEWGSIENINLRVKCRKRAFSLNRFALPSSSIYLL